MLKDREEVLQSLANDDGDVQIDECNREEKCEGNCSHVAEEDLRKLRNMRGMKQQGGRRNSPQEAPEIMVQNRSPQFNFKSEEKAALDKHMEGLFL